METFGHHYGGVYAYSTPYVAPYREAFGGLAESVSPSLLEGFDYETNADMALRWLAGSGGSLSTDSAHGFGKSLQYQSGSIQNGPRFSLLSLGPTGGAMGVWYRHKIPGAGSPDAFTLADILRLRTSDDLLAFRVEVSQVGAGQGRLRLYATPSDGSAEIASDYAWLDRGAQEWFPVELEFSQASVRLYRGADLMASLEPPAGKTWRVATIVHLLSPGFVASRFDHLYVVKETARVGGNFKVRTSLPSGPGHTAGNWTRTNTGLAHWQHTRTSEAERLSTTTPQKEMVTLPALAETGEKVLHVQTWVRGRYTTEGELEMHPVLRAGGVDFRANRMGLIGTLSNFLRNYPVNPSTGLPWKASEVQALQMGVETV